jgi:glycosyltransferase involved in cell wall biosynthesis
MTPPSKKRLAFIDHSFHKVTRSSDFFLEVLNRDYEVTIFFDDGWKGGLEVDPHTVNAGKFDTVLFWQVLPFARNVMRFSCNNLIWVPMYDSEWQRSNVGWRALRLLGLKVICFSKTLYEITQHAGIRSFQVQYFPEVPKETVSYGRPRVFFWQRVDEIGWPLVKRILGENDIEKTVLRDDPDPNHVFTEPDPEDTARFHVEVVRNLKLAGGGKSDEYMRLLSNCNVFIATRLREGIGLSFLEAMALGMCVVAPDAPTMNEYISTEEDGFLFDPEQVSAIDLARFADCGRRARARVAKGREQWETALPAMLEFVSTPVQRRRSYWDTIRLLLWDLARHAKLAIDKRFPHTSPAHVRAAEKR